MLITLKSISAEGLEVNAPLSLASLEERMSHGRQADIKFLEAPSVQLRLTRTSDGAESRGKIRIKYEQNCGVCDKYIPQDVELSARFHFKPTPAGADAVELSEQIGVYYFNSDQIDLESCVQESILLSLSLYWQPPRNKEGECLVCHSKTPEIVSFPQKNEETLLAGLLKPIKVKFKT